jgi:hypothetical protein
MKLARIIAWPGGVMMTSNHGRGGALASTMAISRIFESSRSQIT